ncbi:MAG: ribokinase [Chloroflexi bacterium]|nr:ribokinase [Chloroflexota bacterium]
MVATAAPFAIDPVTDLVPLPDGAARPRVTVVGSYAVGMTLRTDRFPVGGETRHGTDFDMGPGGKGSNQAIQAARLDADTALVTCIGRDAFGDEALAMYGREGVDTTHVARSDRNTGVGFIVLDGSGQNFIVLDMGANHELTVADVEAAADRIASSGAYLTQFEVPIECALAGLRIARRAGVPAILNPAPARSLPREALADVDILTPNQSELRILLGLAADDPADDLALCRELLAAGVGTVVMTRGEQGALIVRDGDVVAVPSREVEVVDTTGAGDAFNGTLATALASGMPLETAVGRATVAGALACRRLGVVPGLPTAAELGAALDPDQEGSPT